MNRTQFIILSKLAEENAYCNVNAMTIKELMESLQVLGYSYNLYYKQMINLLAAGYVAEGLRCGSSNTYYITEPGRDALEIIKKEETRVKNEIGFVALGQAGANIGTLFEKRGYDVFYINSSKEDLGLLQQSAQKYHVQGGEGCNKNRDKAKRLLAKNADEVLNQIGNRLKQNIIFVIFSSGGGTGSGMGPLVIQLVQQELQKSTGAVVVLPGENESIRAHLNAYECAKELADIQDMGAAFFLDNNNRKNKLQINKNFVDLFEELVDIPRNHTSMRGNIDKAEIKEVLTTKGAAMISKLSKQDSGTAQLIESFESTVFAPRERDRAIRYLTLMAAGEINIPALEKEFGLMLDTYQTYDAAYTLCCLSGLSYPFTRILTIKDKVKESQRDIVQSAEAVNANKLNEDINLFGRMKKTEPVKKGSSRDLLKKYL